MHEVHIVSPILVGLFVTVVSEILVRLIGGKVYKYLEGKLDPMIVDTVSAIVRGALSLSNFLINALIFIATLLIATSLYPSFISQIIMIGILVVFCVGVFIESLWLIQLEIHHVAADEYCGRRLTTLLFLQQILMYCIAIGAVLVGLYFSDAGNAGRQKYFPGGTPPASSR